MGKNFDKPILFDVQYNPQGQFDEIFNSNLTNRQDYTQPDRFDLIV
jgi:hypothetical protein